MKFSEQWLREWVNPPVDSATLAERLTMIGFEVESRVEVAGHFSGVVAAQVLAIGRHPDADRLWVCELDDGQDTPVTVVTGAMNVTAGMCVPLARIGAVLADGSPIRPGRLRGVESLGMLCSAVELGMAESAEGILPLPPQTVPGTDVRMVLGLDDVSLELNVTPNRGDAMSLRGVAREVGACWSCDVREPDIVAAPVTIEDRVVVAIDVPESCPQYVGRVIRDVNAAAPVPRWMSERLRRSGLRSISAIVDIANYVMLELGQPLHAFDLDRLSAGITVRHPMADETLALLDGQVVSLAADTLLVADARGPLALAGIMGGALSGVDPSATRHVFLESAYFAPLAVLGQARRYRLHTDASHRFERGVDPALQVDAAERATTLILDICGGRAGPLAIHTATEHLPGRPPIDLRPDRIVRLLGYQECTAAAPEIMRRLGMQVTVAATGWRVTPPSWRFDIGIEHDLIEEIARIGGYDQVPARLPGGAAGLPRRGEGAVDPIQRLRQLLVVRGYHEAIAYSFVDADLNARLGDGRARAISLANPISRDMAQMRLSLWPGLITALRSNQRRHQVRVRLFEIGRVFSNQSGNIIQINKIGGIISGSSAPEQWAMPTRPVDFFDLKGDCEALFAACGQPICVSPARHPALHPGQSAELAVGDCPAGVIGMLHPELIDEFDLKAPVGVFELDLPVLVRAPVPQYLPQSKFPAVRRDLSIVVDRTLPAGEILAFLRLSAPQSLRDLQLFDVYDGEGIDSGKKSIALGLIFQESSSTLIDADVDHMVATIISKLAGAFGAALRE